MDDKQLDALGELWITEVSDVFYRKKGSKSFSEFYHYYENYKGKIQFTESDSSFGYRMKIKWNMFILPFKSWWHNIVLFTIWKLKEKGNES